MKRKSIKKTRLVKAKTRRGEIRQKVKSKKPDSGAGVLLSNKPTSLSSKTKFLPNRVLPKGYFTLIVLAKKHGYAKDYIGWLSRTGRIKAIRYGKYGQWYASEISLSNYTASLASNNQQRYSAQSKALQLARQKGLSPVSSKVFADLVISGPKIIDGKTVSSKLSSEKALPVLLAKKPEQTNYANYASVSKPAESPEPQAIPVEVPRREPSPFRLVSGIFHQTPIGGIDFCSSVCYSRAWIEPSQLSRASLDQLV